VSGLTAFFDAETVFDLRTHTGHSVASDTVLRGIRRARQV
jgi:hypothetical protein